MAHATMMELRAERFKTADALKRVDKLEAQLAEAKSGWDSAIADLREAAKICKEVEDKLAALQWTPISPDNLPKLGRDEVGRWRVNSPTWIVCDVADTPWKGDATVEQYANLGWTHFRPINAPLAAPSKVE